MFFKHRIGSQAWASQVCSRAATSKKPLMASFSSVVALTQTYNAHSCVGKQDFQKQQTNNRDSSPLRKERIDDSVSQRIDGQLRDPLEIFSTADRIRYDRNLNSTNVSNMKSKEMLLL